MFPIRVAIFFFLSVGKSAVEYPSTHLAQVFVVEQVGLSRLKAILTFALMKNVALEFPTAVLFDRHGGGRRRSEIKVKRAPTAPAQKVSR